VYQARRQGWLRRWQPVREHLPQLETHDSTNTVITQLVTHSPTKENQLQLWEVMADDVLNRTSNGTSLQELRQALAQVQQVLLLTHLPFARQGLLGTLASMRISQLQGKLAYPPSKLPPGRQQASKIRAVFTVIHRYTDIRSRLGSQTSLWIPLELEA
jgi:hypothetical protein